MPTDVDNLTLLRHGSGPQRVDALNRLMPHLLDKAKCFIAFDRYFQEGASTCYRDELFGLKSSTVDGVFSEHHADGQMGYGDGVDDVVGLSSLGLNPGTADFSFSVVLQQDPDWPWDSGSHTILGNRGHGEVTSWGLRTGGTNGTLRLSCANILGNSSAGHDIRTAPALVNGTFDRDGDMVLYVDGAAKVTRSIAAGSANSMSQSTFTVWRRGVATFDYAGAWLRDLIIWHDRLLTAGEIEHMANWYGVPQ